MHPPHNLTKLDFSEAYNHPECKSECYQEKSWDALAEIPTFLIIPSESPKIAGFAHEIPTFFICPKETLIFTRGSSVIYQMKDNFMFFQWIPITCFCRCHVMVGEVSNVTTIDKYA